MRIPSQLNDSTLYGRGNRKSPSPDSFRRLIRLTVALALVVVVMRQAGEPGMYEAFFGSPEIDVAEPASPTKLGPPLFAGLAAEETQLKTDAQSQPIPEPIQESARLITEALTVNEQRQWTVVLDHWQKRETFRVMEPVIASTIDLIDQLEDLPEDEREPWRAAILAFGKRFATPDRIPPDSGFTIRDPSTQQQPITEAKVADDLVARQRLSAWLDAMDQAAVERVVDGAIWRSEDFDAFYRQLDQAPTLNSRGALTVSIVPLMQQPKTYLGSKVRVKGNVVRSIKKEATSNPFGVTEYWELWIRPSTGGDRPFVLIVPEVSLAVQAVGADATAKKGPEVEMVGRFFKRLGYASSFGADAAPVIVGRVLGLQTQLAATATGDPTDARTLQTKKRYAKASPALISRLWKTIALALIFGVSIAGVAIWRANVSAQASRRLRNEHRASPETFLSDLSDRNEGTL